LVSARSLQPHFTQDFQEHKEEFVHFCIWTSCKYCCTIWATCPNI